MHADARRRIEAATGKTVAHISPLSGGCVGDVFKIELADGDTLVAKIADAGGKLALEGFMLGVLKKAGLPVPDAIRADDSLLLMTWIDGGDAVDESAQIHAADLLAALHGHTQADFGFDRATLIGGLDQPNPRTASWHEFFRDHRLLYMAGEAHRVGNLPSRTMARVETLAARLERWIEEPSAPSLIHGDMWGGNVLAKGGRIAGFVDPAIYYADAEIELAFSTLFSTFGEPFFRRYAEHRPIRPGFFEERRDLLNLYVRLFGGSYVQSVERTLAKFGC